MEIMKIGLNGQRLLTKDPAGPEKYTYNLFRALSEIDTKNEYVIYFDDKPSDKLIEQITNGNKKFSYLVLPKTVFWTQINLASELRNNPPDIFFTAVHTIPIMRNPKTKFVVMIHGLEYKSNKNDLSYLYKFKTERPLKYAAIHSDKIIVPSTAVKESLLKQKWGLDEKKIETVYEGVGEEFRKTTTEKVEEVRKKYGLGDSPYLLFVSTIQPRKNIPRIIAAFAQLVKENPKYKNTNLILAGKFGWNFEESLESPKKFGIKENVRFLGRVPDKDLPPLFTGAKGYLNFSIDEGFGLPLLEAMSCGVPCAVSDIPAFDEIGGGFPIQVNQNSVDSIKNGIKRLLDGEISTKVVEEAESYAHSFTWQNTAKKTLAIFENIVKNS